MNETNSTPKKRSLLKKLGLGAGVLFLLLIVVYFVATSGTFFKGVILPKVAKAMNAEVTVSEASISPFSQVILRDLKVRTTGTEPLLAAAEVRARYSLFALLGGNIKVEEVALVSPVVQLVQNADGTSNLDPITQSQKSTAKKPEPPAASKPPQIDIKKVALNNATVRIVKNHLGGTRDLVELANVNITLDDLKNAQTGKLGLAADLKLDQHPPAPGTNASVQARLAGNFTFDLTAGLQPGAVKGGLKLDVTQAGGALADLASFAATLDCDATPGEIKQLALRFQKAGANLGEVRVSGPFDAVKTEGNLKMEILNIDRQVLNIAGASSGFDFGGTTINSTNQIQLAQAGDLITAAGQVAIAKFSVTQKGQTTPALDLRTAYNVTVNNKAKTALLQSFTLDGTQNQRPLLLARLASPMNIAWGDAANAVGDSALNLTLTNLNLADWKPFTGDTTSAGVVDATLNLLAKQAGKHLTLDLAAQIAGLNAKFGSNSIQQAGVTLLVRGQAADFKKINLGEYRLQLTHFGQPVANVSGSGTLDAQTQDADLQLALDATLARLFQAMPQPGLSASAGTLGMNAHVVRKGTAQTVTGHVALTNFTGSQGDYKLAGFGTSADLEVTMLGDQLSLRKFAGTLREGVNAGGNFDVTGDYHLAKNAGQFVVKLVDMNQNALRPFLAPSLGDKKLVSVSIHSASTVRLNGADDLTAQASLTLTNLVVSDPKNQFPATPLEARFALDTTMSKKVLDLRQCQFALTPTARATNVLQLTGRIDLTRSNAMQGALKLAAESLDVTPYYNLIADKPKSATPAGTPAPPAPTPPPPPAGGSAEPAPVTLPFQNFTADLNIGRLYLREIAITNWLASVKLDGSRVLLKPCQLSLNGAPVQAAADLDLSVPGYKYDVTFSADKIPVEPLANSFTPEYRSQARGDLLARVQIKGAGTSGASLQKNLSGDVNFTFTNANLQLVRDKYKKLLVPIALVLRTPDLTQSPINWLGAAAKLGEGKINLHQFSVVSEAFTADTAGVIPIAAVLTNSPINQWPVNFALRRSLAEKVNLLPAGTPTNAAYAKLPTFIKLGGTLGEPKTETDKLVIAGLFAKSAAGLSGLVGGKAGDALQGVGSLLTGERSSSTNAAATNKTGSVLQGLGGLFGAGKAAGTNAASTNKAATNPPAKPSFFDRLNPPKK